MYPPNVVMYIFLYCTNTHYHPKVCATLQVKFKEIKELVEQGRSPSFLLLHLLYKPTDYTLVVL